MALRRLPDQARRLMKQDLCVHPQHEPPIMMQLEPGSYEWSCPACANVISFVVPERPTFDLPNGSFNLVLK